MKKGGDKPRTSETIKKEIVRAFGFFPPFYEPAMASPMILENLWQQTRLAYVDNPIPALFKEKLAALLARYCPVPYCLVCHTASLRPLGLEAKEVLSILERPTPTPESLRDVISKARLSCSKPLHVWPASGSEVENALLQLAIAIFQNSDDAAPYYNDVRKFLRPSLCDPLIILIAYNKTCLSWSEAHPELSFEADQRAQNYLETLVSQEPKLADFLRDYRTRFQNSIAWQQQEKKLKKTEKLFKLMVESVVDYAIILIDLEGRITDWNSGAQRLLGFEESEVIGKPLEIFFTPEDRVAGAPQKELAAARSTGHARDERFHMRKDGSRLWVKGFLTAVKAEDGTLQAYVKIMQDLTDRKKIEDELARWNEELEQRVQKRTDELTNSQKALHQAQKLETVGQLAGGVAHDFNNLITGITGISEDLKQSFEPGDPRIEDVDEILKASARAYGVTRQLLAFGRRQIIQPQNLDLKSVVSDLHKLLNHVLGEDIEIRLHLTDTATVRMDKGQLEQVLLNLAINSRDAMPRGGILTIRTSNVELYDGDAPRHFQVAAGAYVMLEVSDTGHGMTRETLAHIFEPFFTTKDKDRGTGLGLATVYGIIKQNRGDIHVYSEVNIGTAFKIFFPSVKKSPDAERTPTPATLASNEGLILVIEDDDIVRRVVVKRLLKHGYRVLSARHGKEAIEIARTTEAMVHLIITDVVMPGMTGAEAVEKICALWPNTPALFMSGYPQDIITPRGILPPHIDFIEKPDIATGLITKVQEVLAKSKPVPKTSP